MTGRIFLEMGTGILLRCKSSNAGFFMAELLVTVVVYCEDLFSIAT